MKTSKRPVFKLNTSELPKDYKPPIKPKKRKGHRGPRRIVRSRRRNEFIPENTDWCQINGQKLRQDIFFGEKRGRKFIPDGPPNFFVPSADASASPELLEAPYGDGGDGGACGCACEGCVCGEGEGCSCSGPGTDGDQGSFGQGAQDGQQGQQGQQGQEGQEGQQGQQGDTFGQNLGDVFGPEGTYGVNDTFGQNLGDVFGPEGTYGVNDTFGQNLGDVFGPEGTYGVNDTFGQNLGDVFGPEGTYGVNDTFGQNLGDVFGPEGTFGPSNFTGPMDPNDPTGSTLSTQDFFGPSTGRGPENVNDPNQWSMLDLPTMQNDRGVGLEFNPNQDVIGRGFMDDPLGGRGFVNPTYNTQQLGPYDDPMSTISGVPGVQTMGAPAGRDAQTAIEALTGKDPQSLMNTIQEAPSNLLNAIQDMLGINQAEAQGKNQSQFGNPLSSILSNPDPSQGNLNAAFVAAQNMNTQQAQTNPGLMAAMQSFANPEDPGAKGLPGLTLDPEAPTSHAGAFVGPAPSANPGWFTGEFGNQMMGLNAPTGFPSSLENPGRDPVAINPQDVPTQEQMQAGRDQLAQDLQQSQQANPFGMQQDDSRAGVTQQQINEAYQQQAQQPQDPNIPTPEQMQEARDTLARDMERGPTNQPSIEEFWEGIPAISRSQEETDRGRTMENPNIYPTMQELFDAREQQLAGRDFTAKELQQERQSQLEQQRSDRDVELQEQKALERSARDPVAPTRGQERGSRESRGAPFAPTSRGQTQALGRGPGLTNLGPNLGRDAPGVQGLPAGLRGNEIAQALIGRGFDANLVGAALTINDGGKMLSSMLEAAGLSHSQAQQTANAARGAVEAQHGLPSNRR